MTRNPRQNVPTNRIGMRRAPNDRESLRSRAKLAGFISHGLPIVVLVVGLTCWLSIYAPALGQGFSNQRLRTQNLQLPNSNQNFTQPRTVRSNNTAQQFANPGTPRAQIARAPAFTNSPAQAGNQGRTNSIPSIEGVPQPTAGSGSNSEVANTESSWQMPAFVSKIAEGGWLMLPLGICSLIVLALSFERMISLRRSRVIPRPFVRRFTECVEDGQLSFEEATELCEEFDCPVAEVFQAAIRRWGRPMFEIEQAVMDAGDRVADRLKRFLRVFHAISNVAPLIGLLGTVIGMISAFETLSDPGAGGQQDLLASGISTALMTTAGGLTVAIPAYLAYMYFSSKSDTYLNEIDKLCQRVVDCISAEGLEGNNAGKSRKRRAA